MDVRIIHLEPLRVASVLGYGKEPEMQAWDKMFTWAESHQLPDKSPRFFGFNNPSPSPGSPNYGYEVWITVGNDVKSDESVTVKDFGGGDYAVTRHTGVEGIPETWMQLSAWVETSPYRMASHQWLEEHIKVGRDVPPEQFVLDLFLPIKS
jgi:DNA gyrase inhibitor GyrI